MKLVIVINDPPHLTEQLLDCLLDSVEEHRPAICINLMCFESFAFLEFEYEEDVSDFAVFLMLSYDNIEVSVY